MPFCRRHILRFVGAAAATGVLPRPSAALDYPMRPVRFIVPLAPGGGLDFVARLTSEYMSRAVGQQFYIENKLGAGGMIGIETAAKSAPDGYSVLISNDNVASAPQVLSVIPDSVRDLVPVIELSRQTLVLAVHNSFPVKSVAEFVAAAKARPGMSFATSGVGSNQHILAEWFAKTAGIKLEHVPYRGAGQAVNDLIAGHVLIGFLGPTALLPHYKTGTLRFLAQSSRARARPKLAGSTDARGGGLYGSGARILVWRLRAGRHPDRRHRVSECRDGQGHGGCSDPRQPAADRN